MSVMESWVGWLNMDEFCGDSRRLIWLSLLVKFLLSDLSSTCLDTGGSLAAGCSRLTLPRVLAEVRARSIMATWLGLSDSLCLWEKDRLGDLALGCWCVSRDDDSDMEVGSYPVSSLTGAADPFLNMGLNVFQAAASEDTFFT